jgi:hypothetical protein
LQAAPTLRHIAWHAACVLAPATALESRGKVWGEQPEGGTQGDPETGAYFNVGIQEDVEVLNDRLAVHRGMARFGHDDGYAVGRPEHVFPAVAAFAAAVEARCGLLLVASKSEVYCRESALPGNSLPGFTLAGTEVGEQWENGFICYGVPVGSDTFVKAKMIEKVEEVARKIRRARQVLGGEKQGLWTVLRQSFNQQLDWWLTLVYPSLIRDAARRMDEIVWEALEDCAGSAIPQGDQGKGWDCPLTAPVAPWQGRSYQELKVRQPTRSGGLGLTSLEDLSPVAFVGGLQQCIPHFIGTRGLCTLLRGVVGGPSGELQPPATLWQPLLASGCRTGRELAESWARLQGTAEQACAYLGRELQGALAAPVEGMGDGAEDGSIRRLVTEQLQGLQKAVLEKSLEDYPDQAVRPVIHIKQLDKISSGWVNALPGPDSYIPTPAFSEAMCGYLCVPSPACKEYVGLKVGKETVDIWGDKVQSATLPGDLYRYKHDQVKMKLYSLANECRLPATCEVFGAFSSCIPQQGLSRIQRGRARQAILPDFKFELPHQLGGNPAGGNPGGGNPAAGKVSTLAELKTVTFCQSYHYPGATKRGVELRADKLPAEYLKKARDCDQDFCGTAHGTIGPVEAKLRSYPPLMKLVSGPNAEFSSDTHELLQTMADCKAQYQCRSQGLEESEWRVASNLCYLRRQLSICAVRSVADSLFCRLQQAGVGPGRGARLAAQRRALAMAQQERGRKERAAHWLQHTRGHRVLQRGQFLET